MTSSPVRKYLAIGVPLCFTCLMIGIYYFRDFGGFNRTTHQFDGIGKIPACTERASDQLTPLLARLSSMSVAQPPNKSDINSMLSDLRTALSSLHLPSNSSKVKSQLPNADVCPEKFAFKKLDGGFPHFYKGFNMLNCTGVPAFNTLLTMVYNFVHYSSEDLPNIPRLLNSVNKVYPGIAILAALPSDSKLTDAKFNHTTFTKYSRDTAETDIWKKLIAKVKTKYVYIGKNVIHLTWFDRLERLVREVTDLNASVIASAFRTLRSGIWSTACEQTTLRNYTLVYEHGYRKSPDECMKCDHVEGPFVSKTQLFAEVPIKPSITGTSGFAIWFLTLKQIGKQSFSCPDSMSFLTDNSQLPTSKKDWIQLAKLLQVEKIYPTQGPLLEFDCAEANTDCPQVRGKGLALSHCCMRKLIVANKLVMRLCKEKGIICELESGLLLGAIKFNGILPWEIDGDVTLESSNYTSFEKIIGPLLAKQQYSLELHHKDRYFVIRFKRKEWFVELYTVSSTDTVRLAKQGFSPTMIYYDGVYVETAASPGLYARNRYGSGCFQHAQHWRGLGMKTGWMFYQAGKFSKCSKPGHHACLDQFVGDGNIQFRLP